jgi:hypothetical protein
MVVGALLCLLLRGPVQLLAAMHRVNILDGRTVTDLLAVSKFGGTSYTQNKWSNAARLVALTRYRIAHPAASDADAAVYLSTIFGQGNPALFWSVYHEGTSSTRRVLLRVWRVGRFALGFNGSL